MRLGRDEMIFTLSYPFSKFLLARVEIWIIIITGRDEN